MTASVIAVAATVMMCVTPRLALGDPHADYMLHCQGCHGPEGRGAPGGVPSFRGMIGRFQRVDGGREYLVRVPGAAQSELSDARLASVLNWIVSTFSDEVVAPDIVSYSEREVSVLRRSPLVDVTPVRAELMRLIELEQVGRATAAHE